VVFGGLDAYLGRMREDPSGSALFTIPEHQSRSLAVTIAGALISLVSLIFSLSEPSLSALLETPWLRVWLVGHDWRQDVISSNSSTQDTGEAVKRDMGHTRMQSV